MTLRLLLFCLPLLLLTACEDDDECKCSPLVPELDVPATYEFIRDGVSTVAFSGQTDRLAMVDELSASLKDFSSTEAELDAQFTNPEGADPFQNPDLNASTKSIRSKVAASRDLFFADATNSAEIKADFDTWIAAQVNEVFPAQFELAAPGQPGRILDGDNTRYVDAKGREYDQLIVKSLIGALSLDQAVNNYLRPSVLDEADNREQNELAMTAEGKPYTTMEHKWDEAYGYVFGGQDDPADPLPQLGSGDALLNKYLGRVENQGGFEGIAQQIYDAFRVGRAAIVAGEYDIRDRQAELISERLSQVVAVRAIYYLDAGAERLAADPADRSGAFFHDLSEGYGFVYSLRFTRSASGQPYFTHAEVEDMLAQLDAGNGFWDVEASTLAALSDRIRIVSASL